MSERRGFVPQVLVVPAVLGLALLVVPLTALVGRVDWSTLWADVTSPAALSALGLSVVTAAIATVVCAVLGVPLALLIARSGARVAALLRAVVTVPLVLPPMVGGVALLFLLGRNGWLGRLLGSALLRSRGKARSHLPCLNTGLRALQRERRHARDRGARLVAFIDAFTAGVVKGLEDHDRWSLARQQLARKLVDRRSTSKLPALIDYVMSRPIVSAGMVAKELSVTPRAAQDLIYELGLREVTGKGRYRAWGVL